MNGPITEGDVATVTAWDQLEFAGFSHLSNEPRNEERF